MKAVAARMTTALQVGTRLKCDDNSGAKELEILAVKRYKGKRRRLAKAAIASLVICSVKKGKPDIRKKIVKAIIIRQKKEFRRANGLRVKFNDNAAVLVNDDGMPKGSEIKGVVAKEVAERYAKIATIAKNVV